jgi:hypothetical protein
MAHAFYVLMGNCPRISKREFQLISENFQREILIEDCFESLPALFVYLSFLVENPSRVTVGAERLLRGR